MNRPWMPLYVGDYLADTAHLRAIEHGAYLLLIMHYWRTGGLPDDDAALARISRTSRREWRRIRPILKLFFQEQWKHKRVEFELTNATRLSRAARLGGVASGAKRREKSAKNLNDRSTIDERLTNDARTIGQALTLTFPSLLRKEGPAAEAAPSGSEEKELFERGKKVLGNSRGTGGLIAKLLNAKFKGNVALARAAIEQASTKHDPREYIGRIVRGASEETKRIGVQI